ncbi:MAG: ABC transporter ATP-binding protein [Gammaproteobacteria bacterium RBG_16_51_14]|nr:MAG: ABC transporter ATP-binding protein [Gammaproteobacteria bacterium RBG_16_51_14]
MDSKTRTDAQNPGSGILPLRLTNVGYCVCGRRLLSDINITFSPGGNTVVLGPNGAGKSLLLRLCHGLIKPTTGVIEWQDSNAGQYRQYQAMVFQRPVMLRRSVAANIEYPLRLNKVPKRERQQMLRQALETAGLMPLAGRHARILSGGEQQRVALARAWVLHPEVLFLDEPTTNLDPSATRAVEEIVMRFKAAGTKIIMTTHDLGQARRMADEVIFLHNGRVLESGPANEFFTQPRTLEGQAYLRGELLC